MEFIANVTTFMTNVPGIPTVRYTVTDQYAMATGMVRVMSDSGLSMDVMRSTIERMVAKGYAIDTTPVLPAKSHCDDLREHGGHLLSLETRTYCPGRVSHGAGDLSAWGLEDDGCGMGAACHCDDVAWG